MVLLLDGVVQQLAHRLNEYFRHERLERSQVKISDMYAYVPILLLSHAKRLEFERPIQLSL